MMRSISIALAACALAALTHSGPASADQQFCSRYAKHAMGPAGENVDRKCGFTGPRWSTDENFHLTRCLSDLAANLTNPTGYQAAKTHFDQEDRTRIAEILQCRALKAAEAPDPAPVDPAPVDPAPAPVEAGPAPVGEDPAPVGGGGGKINRTVSQATDLYEAKEGKKIGGDGDFLRPGQEVITVVPGCGNEWCELSNPKGWVWGGHLK
jgi:hypothetical protein